MVDGVGEQRYMVEVDLRRLSGSRGGSGLSRAYTPRFPKVHSISIDPPILLVCREPSCKCHVLC